MLDHIQRVYGVTIASSKPAPRQFVAETYYLEATNGERYFCKIITKPLFIPQVIDSLPALREMFERGRSFINYPIETTTKALYTQFDDALIVLFNYIAGTQHYDYSHAVLGRCTAEVHALTPQINAPVPRETFTFRYGDALMRRLDDVLSSSPADAIETELHDVLAQYQREMRHDWAQFETLCARLRIAPPPLVLTHGDAPGNVLVQSPDVIFIIDWDEILLAPAERDVWFLHEDADFLRGYREIYPTYQPNSDVRRYYLYTRYFADIMEFLDEIISTHPADHRQHNLDGLKHDCFGAWLRPLIRAVDPFDG
ncbi:MAG: aminoglycoside phosphotransferase family protein [Anaerolineae bacterium]|nr:aminoglycoside phosphotransferase family protein [Anaerolineae bacterium]